MAGDPSDHDGNRPRPDLLYRALPPATETCGDCRADGTLSREITGGGIVVEVREDAATWMTPEGVVRRWLALTRGGGREIEFAEGAILFHQGDVGDAFYLLRRGLLRASCLTDWGDERLIEVMGPGTLFGEGPAMEGSPRLVTVSALTRVLLLRYDRATARAAMARDPRVASCLLEVMAAKQRSLMSRLTEASTLAPEERLRRLLDRLEALQHTARLNARDLGLTHAELASYLGLSRVTVTRAVGRIRRDQMAGASDAHSAKSGETGMCAGLTRRTARRLIS